jgi:glutamate carboxypeptidase
VARRAFVLEPSFGAGGALKVARKGIGRYEVTIRGRAAHAGLDPGAGISAIVEASHQIQAIDALNDPGCGVTVNVGTVEGGLRPNVVAPEATIVVEARAPRVADAERVDRALLALAPVGEGAEVHVSGGFGRPPMERTPGAERLMALAQEAAHSLGTEIEGAAVGGASDGNLISALVPVLDGLGAVGGGAHADDEHVVVADMPVRAALLALLLAAPVPGRAARGVA